MTFKLEAPSDIYQRINQELSHIVESLNTYSADALLNQAQENARAQLASFQRALQTQLVELEKNAEWNTFTIAFYGETGAGKSTLIETLRILLQEPTKLANQQAFREQKNEYALYQDKLCQLQHSIRQIDARLNELTKQATAIHDHYQQLHCDAGGAMDQADARFAELETKLSVALQQREQAYSEALHTITQLQALIAAHKKSVSFWQRLLGLFRKTQEEVALARAVQQLPEIAVARDNASASLSAQQGESEQGKLALMRKLSEVEIARDSAISELLNQQTEEQQNRTAIQQQLHECELHLEELLVELEKLADGEIIGDGRADFTRQTQRYELSLNDESFALLDVPGIEGKEGLVLQEIEKAVQTAHAVFYVTNQAAPPQTGDEQRKGTLEKIKHHLGAQTEVWTIFNKKITNPKYSLKHRPLISEDDEKPSLARLNETMTEQLGDHHREVVPLAALPAFLASTDHFAPNSQNAKRRSKFFEDFSPAELLAKSHMQAFLQLLAEQLIGDSRSKITRANFNKAKDAVDQTIQPLEDIHKTFTELAEKLNGDGESTRHQLNSSYNALQKRLNLRGETLIDELASKVRKEMDSLIGDDISNDSFKASLRSCIDQHQTRLNQKIPKALSAEIERFQKDAEEILKRFDEFTNELASAYTKLRATKFNQQIDLKIKMSNGINTAALLGGLVGIGMAPFTGGASLWVAGGAALSIIISLGKAVASFFSSDYKKSQQRKATNDNLRYITEQFTDTLRDGLNSVLPGMQKAINQLEKAIAEPGKQAAASAQCLKQSSNELKILSQQIKSAGAL